MLYAQGMPIIPTIITIWVLSGPAIMALLFVFDHVITRPERITNKRFSRIIRAEYELD